MMHDAFRQLHIHAFRHVYMHTMNECNTIAHAFHGETLYNVCIYVCMHTGGRK
jgi:hypothetical protein